ncbi:hypothetical protein BBAD15_g8053 [Beauveria bassiana D1-5]|uniref:Uncharacterized protein n=1 Tax=Beauveria bassiana D1-5 TaxID=1245745 RepID=A0A0A2VFJ2_BEABA|nr:hypothetical protein BBAD15_g8053 [Beauveria bassiana D1-5]
MSLAQHLTVEDEFECDLPDENPNHAQGSWRRMSFDAFAPVRPHLDIAEDTPNPEAAYKASTLRRISRARRELLLSRFGHRIWRVLQQRCRNGDGGRQKRRRRQPWTAVRGAGDTVESALHRGIGDDQHVEFVCGVYAGSVWSAVVRDGGGGLSGGWRADDGLARQHVVQEAGRVLARQLLPEPGRDVSLSP